MSFFGFDGPFGGMPSMFSDAFFADSDSDDFSNYSRSRGSEMNRRQRSGPVDNETYYKVLGVDKDATTADIHKAFRKQAMKHHPDRGGDAQTVYRCFLSPFLVLCIVLIVCYLVSTH